MMDRAPRQEVPAEPQGPPAQRNVSLLWPEYQRLHDRRRKIAAATGTDPSLGKTVSLLLDLADKIDAEDLP